MLALYYDTDYRSFEKVIIYQFLKQFSDFVQHSYITEKYPNISKENLNLRKSICFGNQMFFVTGRTLEQLQKHSIQILKQEAFLKNDHIIYGDFLTINDCLYQVTSLYNSQHLTILKILARKKHTLVNNEQITPEKATASLEMLIELDGLEQVFIMDDPTLPMNNPNMFDIVNTILAFSFPFYLNYLNVNSFKKDIEEKIKSESEDTSMLEGI